MKRRAPTQSKLPRIKYDPSFPDTALRFCSIVGGTNEELAQTFNVSPSAIIQWQKKHTLFAAAIKEGRFQYDSNHIVRSLKDRATGYEYDEVQEEYIELDGKHYIETTKSKHTGEDSKGKSVYVQIKQLRKGIKRKVIHKKIVPDVMAIMFWLQNRQPEDWKNVQKQLVEGKVDHQHKHQHELDLTKLGKEGLENLSSLLKQGSIDVDPVSAPSGTGSGIQLLEALH